MTCQRQLIFAGPFHLARLSNKFVCLETEGLHAPSPFSLKVFAIAFSNCCFGVAFLLGRCGWQGAFVLRYLFATTFLPSGCDLRLLPRSYYILALTRMAFLL